MKVCTKCKESKQLTDFSKDKYQKSGLKSWCKLCYKKYDLAHVAEAKAYRKKNRKRSRNNKLKLYYGITQQEYNIMFNQQEGKCDICKQHQSNFNKPLFIDHNHETGVIRGLLCINCNMGVGSFKDDSTILLMAVEYLNKQKDKA